jgi:hypothetical protein
LILGFETEIKSVLVCHHSPYLRGQLPMSHLILFERSRVRVKDVPMKSVHDSFVQVFLFSAISYTGVATYIPFRVSRSFPVEDESKKEC